MPVLLGVVVFDLGVRRQAVGQTVVIEQRGRYLISVGRCRAIVLRFSRMYGSQNSEALRLGEIIVRDC